MDKIIYSTKPDPKSLPGFFEPTLHPVLDKPVHVIRPVYDDSIIIIENALSNNDCDALLGLMKMSDNFEDVGVQGMREGKDDRIGSKRTSIWSPETAAQIFDKLKIHLPDMVINDNRCSTDWWQKLDTYCDVQTEYMYDYEFYPVGVSPLLRFMQYGNGGQHYAHYDAGYIYDEDPRYRTLKSMVIYLTTNEGAATRFVNDGQEDLPVWDREHNDWSRQTDDREVYVRSECVKGNVLLFDHRLCHDVEQYFGTDPRIIIRGDIVYKAGWSKLLAIYK